jgi:hypothetical protein
MIMDRTRDDRTAPPLSDEELEHFGELYVRCNLREDGLSFKKYLENPEYYLRKHARIAWPGKPRVADDRPWLQRLFRFRASDPARAD